MQKPANSDSAKGWRGNPVGHLFDDAACIRRRRGSHAAGKHRANQLHKPRRLEVRLARDRAEVAAFQSLRYRVFYEEMSAVADARAMALRRDADDFDGVCDHLLVIDHDRVRDRGSSAVVGGYRLLRGSVAALRGGFYTAAEYDIGALSGHSGEALELGRSCVHAAYRDGVAIQLLLRAIAAYVARYRIGLIFGCASLPGVDPQALALPLSYLAHNHLAPPELRPVALAKRYVEMKRLAPGAVDARAALDALPPLIKGYLRAGGLVGEGAVIDRQFGTIDVCMVIDTDCVTDKFRRRYQR